ncbi:MAG: CBS domain-containing protein, partial [Candidatus Aenigmatarchaeota archaeon]
MRIPGFGKRLKVKDAMTTELAKIGPDATIKDAAKTMSEFRVGNVLVVDDNEKLVGLITERDIVRKAVAKGKLSSTKAKDLVTTPIMFVSPEDELIHASDKMLRNKITRLPVVDLEKKEVIGILTMKDIMSVLPSYLMDKIEWLRIHPGGEAKKGKR